MTEEQIKVLVEERDMIDYEAYMLLVEIRDEGHLPRHLAEQVDEMRTKRRALDTAIVRGGVVSE